MRPTHDEAAFQRSHLAMKPPSNEVSPCDDPRSLLENCASPRCGSHVRARLSTVTSVFAAGWPLVRNRLSTITSCSPSRCLRSRSSFDVRARIHTRVPPSSVLANVPRRSPRVFTTFRPFRSSGPRSPSRVRIRVRLSTLTAVSTPSAHSPRARELVSRFDGIHCDPLSRTAAPHRSRPSRSCSSCDDHVRVSVPPCLRMISALGQRRPPSRGLKLAPLPRHPDRPASLDAHDPKALPCSRSRNVFTCFALGFRLELTPIHARVHFTSCDVIEHTHCARSYSAYCHRESLALSSPNSPPRSSF
jgi:hypothetical protein